MDRDRPTTTVKPGEPATERWPAWPRPSRVASSCSRRPAAAPAPTSFSASRTPSYHSPKNKSLICFVFLFFVYFSVSFSGPHFNTVLIPRLFSRLSPCGGAAFTELFLLRQRHFSIVCFCPSVNAKESGWTERGQGGGRGWIQGPDFFGRSEKYYKEWSDSREEEKTHSQIFLNILFVFNVFILVYMMFFQCFTFWIVFKKKSYTSFFQKNYLFYFFFFTHAF